MGAARRDQLIARCEALAATLGDGDLGQARRAALEVELGRHATAYGELLPRGFESALSALGAGSEDHLLDLGSGRGLFVLAAPLLRPGLRATGIEVAAERHELALQAAESLLATQSGTGLASHSGTQVEAAPEGCTQRGASTLCLGDLRTHVWPQATLIWLANTALPAPVEARALTLVSRQSSLRRLLATRSLPQSAHAQLEALGELDLPVSWTTRQRVHLYAPRAVSGTR